MNKRKAKTNMAFYRSTVSVHYTYRDRSRNLSRMIVTSFIFGIHSNIFLFYLFSRTEPTVYSYRSLNIIHCHYMHICIASSLNILNPPLLPLNKFNQQFLFYCCCSTIKRTRNKSKFSILFGPQMLNSNNNNKNNNSMVKGSLTLIQ